MFRFFAEKYPERPESKDLPTSEEVISVGLLKPDSVHRMALNMFVSIYSEFLGDMALRTLCYGGLYLVGSLSISVAEYLRDPKTGFLANYTRRRPYLSAVLNNIPVVVSKEADLGLKGAFV
jgi:glucokinase